MMGAGTRFHHHGTSVELGEELDQVLAAELLAQQSFAMPVLAVHVEAVLAEINADERNVLHDGLRAERTVPYKLSKF